MSLINGMLRDLEARRSDGPGSQVFAGQIHAVPAQDDRHRKRWLFLGAVLFISLLVWIFWRPLAPEVLPPVAINAATVRVSAPAQLSARPAPAVVAEVAPAKLAPVAPAVLESKPPANVAAPVAESNAAKLAAELVPRIPPARDAAVPKPAEVASAKPAAMPIEIKRNIIVEDANAATTAMGTARTQLEKGELRAAIDTLERNLPEAIERADYNAFLAALLQRDEQHKRSVDHYVLSLQKSPQTGVWWLGLGISRQALQQLDEAQDAFKRAKASNSLNAELTAFVDARLAQLSR